MPSACHPVAVEVQLEKTSEVHAARSKEFNWSSLSVANEDVLETGVSGVKWLGIERNKVIWDTHETNIYKPVASDVSVITDD